MPSAAAAVETMGLLLDQAYVVTKDARLSLGVASKLRIPCRVAVEHGSGNAGLHETLHGSDMANVLPKPCCTPCTVLRTASLLKPLMPHVYKHMPCQLLSLAADFAARSFGCCCCCWHLSSDWTQMHTQGNATSANPTVSDSLAGLLCCFRRGPDTLPVTANW